MGEPKPKRSPRGEDEPEPLEAGLRGPSWEKVEREEDLPPDEYLLLKVVEANGEHLRTMRWGLGLGTFVLLVWVAFGPLLAAALGLGAFGGGLAVFLLAGVLLAAGLHALQRQLELLRRAVAATDHYVFGPPHHHEK
jgi:hypothetical protein